MRLRHHLLLCLIGFSVDPAVHAIASFEVIVDVVETLIPTWHTLLAKDEYLLAKAAPKATLVAPTNAAFSDVIADEFIVGYLVAVLEMFFKCLSCVEYSGTYAISLR